MDARQLKEVLRREMEIPAGVDLKVSENNPNLLLLLRNGKQVFSYALCPDWSQEEIIKEAKSWLGLKVGATRK